MAEDYEGMTVAELKALLKEQGLPVSGKKADLIERLSGAQEERFQNQKMKQPQRYKKPLKKQHQKKNLMKIQMMIGTMTGMMKKMKAMSQSRSLYFQKT